MLDLAQVLRFDPVPPGLPAGEARVLGGAANLWTEYVPSWRDVDRQLFPRLPAMAEALWARPPLAAAAGPKVGDPAVIGRDFTEFWGRVQGQYALLDEMGVRRGSEARPVRSAADWEPQVRGWRVKR